MLSEQNPIQVIRVIFKERCIPVSRLHGAPVVIQPLLGVIYTNVGDQYLSMPGGERDNQSLNAMRGKDVAPVSKRLFNKVLVFLDNNFLRAVKQRKVGDSR